MVKIDASSPENVCNIEIKKSKNIFSKHNHYTVTIEGIKHHYVDKPADSRDASTTGLNFTPIKLSENKINDTALIFSKMCAEDKTYKPVEFIEKMIEKGNIATAAAILSNENLSNEKAAMIFELLNDENKISLIQNMELTKALKIIAAPRTYNDSLAKAIDKIKFNQSAIPINDPSAYKIADMLTENISPDLSGKIVEKMCDADAFKTANIMSLISDSRAATILSNITADKAAKIIKEMAMYTYSYDKPDIFLDIKKAAAILSDKNLPDEVAADIFSKLPHDIQEKIYDEVTDPVKQLNLLKKCKPHTK